MSYEIYKSIKQLPNGDFECVSASSNTTNVYGNRDFHRWIMTYFSKEYPECNNELKKALWILESPANGDKFYPANWKADQMLASRFMHEKGYKYDTKYNNKNLWIDHAKEFIIYKNSLHKNQKKKEYYVTIKGQYVERKTAKKVFLTYHQEEAKIYKAYDTKELEDMFKGYNSYGVIVQEINKGE